MKSRPMMRVCAAAALLSLVACGGGGGGGSSAAPAATAPTVAATEVQFSATVVSSTSATTSVPVVGATVSVATTDSTGALKTVSAVTDATGAYTITVPAATLVNAPQVVLTIAQTGYQPVVEIYSNVAGGTAYGGNNSAITASNVTAPETAKIVISPLASGQYAPVDGIGPIHLGNGTYDSVNTSANYGFQVPVTSTSALINIVALTGVDLAKYKSLSININFRGLEPVDCADKITFFQSLDKGTTQTHPQNLPFTGNTTSGYQLMTLSPSIVGLDAALGDMYLKIESGACVLTKDPADDFEFANVLVQLNP